MSAASNDLETSIQNHILRNTAYTAASTLYFSLHTASPGESGYAGEVATGSFARVAVTNNPTNFPQCAITGDPTKLNGTAIQFPVASAGWGTVTHWSIYDSATLGAGTLLASGSLATPRTVITGQSPRLGVGTVSFTLGNSTGGGLTDTGKRKALDLIFGAFSFPSPTTIFTGLGTDFDGTTFSEWSDGVNYTRQPTGFNAPSDGVCLNTNVEIYNANVITPVSLTHFGIWDAATSGTLLYAGPLNSAVAASATDNVSLAATTLSIQIL
jgi:hypothetical protein